MSFYVRKLLATSRIPTGWEAPLLDAVAIRGSGHTPDKKVPAYWNGNIKWVSLKDSERLDRRFIRETVDKTTASGIDNSSAVLHPAGTVVLSRDAGVGKSAILAEPMAVSQHFIAWQCGLTLHNVFLYYWLQLMKPEFDRMANGSTILTIGLEYFEKFRLLLPPIAEQQRIAEILEAWDDTIEKVGKLIEAKRKLKRGLMQQLVTGRLRLPRFANKDWSTVRIGEILAEVERYVEWNDDQTYRLLSVRRRSGGLFFREELKGSQILTKNMKLANAGDFLISKMQIVHGASGLVTTEFDGGHISDSYIALVPKYERRVSMEFFNLLSQLPEFYHLTYICSYGVHIEKMTFNLEDFLRAKVLLPESTEEQTAIVEAVNAAGAGLDVLHSLYSQLSLQKRGLMQKLLTGQIRVRVVEQEVGA